MPTPYDPSVSDYIFNPTAVLSQERVFYEGLITEGDLAIWLGREKHRKTNLLLQFAICAALGLDFLQFKFKSEEPLKVVIVDYESKSNSLKKRYDSICAALALTDDQNILLKKNLQILEVRKFIKEGNEFPHLPVKTNKETEKNAHEFWCNLVEDHPADLYILDPMRSVHTQDENDSSIEQLLTAIRKMFKNVAVVIAHHMRKRGNNPKPFLLREDMRVWSDDARGSGAIKAHADTIICQEREIQKQVEVLYFGAYLKDGADIEPIPLEESDSESFYWQVRPEVPKTLRPIYAALKAAGGKFSDKGEAKQIALKAGIPKSTAYRHINELINKGLLTQAEDELVLNVKAPDSDL